MNCRVWLAVAATFVAVCSGLAQMQKYICDQNCRRKDSPCPSPCNACPAPAPCPAPVCPRPKCPAPPPKPRCPPPICPTLPEVPPCPKPVVNITCPPAKCARRMCQPCPACPEPQCPGVSTAAPTTTMPPPGYDLLDGADAGGDLARSRYRLYKNSKSWTDANITCTDNGAYLAIPNSEDELTKLITMLKNAGMSSVHVGFVKPNETFITALGDPMDSYQNSLWPTDELSHPSWKCALLLPEDSKISSEPCSDLHSYLCELRQN